MRVVADVEVAADAAHVGVAEGRCGLVHRHAQLVGGESGVHEFLEKLVLDGVEAGVQPLGGGGNGGSGGETLMDLGKEIGVSEKRSGNEINFIIRFTVTKTHNDNNNNNDNNASPFMESF